MDERTPDDEAMERIGSVEEVDESVGDAKESDVDDDEDTDHLARLSDPRVLAEVERLEEAEHGQHYAEGDEGGTGPE
jgi:hypothetical protein